MKKIVFLFIFLCTYSLFAQTLESIDVISALTLIEENAENPAFTIIDVRTAEEYLPAHIEGAFMRDYYADDFEMRLDSLNKDRVYLVYCQSGGRSGNTLQLMENLGFQTVYNMLGGMNAWNAANYPTTDVIPEYIDLTATLETETNTNINQLSNTDISFYPNPAKDFIQIEENSAIQQLKIYNSQGQLVYEIEINTSKIDIRNLPNGNYLLQFFNYKNEIIAVKKLAK